MDFITEFISYHPVYSTLIAVKVVLLFCLIGIWSELGGRSMHDIEVDAHKAPVFDDGLKKLVFHVSEADYDGLTDMANQSGSGFDVIVRQAITSFIHCRIRELDGTDATLPPEGMYILAWVPAFASYTVAVFRYEDEESNIRKWYNDYAEELKFPVKHWRFIEYHQPTLGDSRFPTTPKEAGISTPPDQSISTNTQTK